MKSIPEDTFTNSQVAGYETIESPVPYEPHPETPTVLETIGISAGLTSDIPAAIKYIGSIGDRISSLNTESPPGWKPWDEDYSDIPSEYLVKLFDSSTPAEFLNKKKNILEEIEVKSNLERGNHGIAGFIGSGLGAIFSLSSAIPIAAGAKYATMGAGFFKNAARQAPGILAQSAARNAIISAAYETKDAQDWAIDTMVETAFALPIVGALGARAASKIQKGKEFYKERFNNIEFLSEANPDGTFKSYVAVAGDGGSAGAMKSTVDRAQKAIDEGLHSVGESGIFKTIFGLSPIVKGLTSKSNVVREWTNNMFSHNMLTGKIVGGQNQLPPAEAVAKYWFARTDSVHAQVNALWADHIGINGPLKDMRARLGSDTMLRSEFEEAISYAMRRGDIHEIPAVQEAAKLVRGVYDDLYGELVRLELLPPNLSPVGAMSYMNRVYNKAKLTADKDGFISSVAADLSAQNKIIREHTAPIDIINEELKEVRILHRGAKGEERRQLLARIEELKQKRSVVKESLQTRIDAGEFDISLLEGRPQFSGAEIEEIKALRKPFEESEARMKSLKEERKLALDAYRKEKSPEAKAKKKEIYERLKEERLAKEKISREFESQILENKISPDFYRFVKGGRAKLVDLDKRPFFRTPISDEKLPEVVRMSYDTIMQENEEQMVARMFGQVKSGGNNPTKSRTLMASDRTLEPYLENNAMTLMRIHAGWVGKHVGMEDVWKRYGTDAKDGMAYMAKELEKEFEELAAGKSGDEKIKLQKEHNEMIDFINTTHQIYWGNYTRGGIRGKTGEKIDSFLRSLRNYTAGTMLGNLPILQPIELFANCMKHGVWPTIEDGLLPMLGSMSRKLSRESAADAYLGINTVTNSYMNQMYGNGTQYLAKTGLERVTSNIAQFSMNASGSNQIADVLETMSSRISASRTIRALQRVAKGETLEAKEAERLAAFGLNSESMAKRIMSQFERHGERISAEGAPDAYLANYQEWKDFKASQAMVMSIQKEVRATILKPNLLDVPFAFRNEFVASMTQFMSYSFAATNSFLIPLLQRPDAEKMIGLMMMIGCGATVPVLRQISKGEEVDLRPDKLLFEGIINSGAGGFLAHGLSIMNSAFDIPYLEEYKPHRFRNKGAAQLLAGPIGGMFDNAQNVASMFASGQINEAGMKRMNYMLPSIFHNWYTTYLTNTAIESIGLPATSKDAKKWFED